MKNDGESICCQGFLLPVNAGIVFMRPLEPALTAVVRFRERVLSGPCWGQAAMHWALFELCREMRCDVLDPKRFASAGPLAALGSQKLRPAMTLGFTKRKALLHELRIHLDVDASRWLRARSAPGRGET